MKFVFASNCSPKDFAGDAASAYLLTVEVGASVRSANIEEDELEKARAIGHATLRRMAMREGDKWVTDLWQIYFSWTYSYSDLNMTNMTMTLNIE